MKPIAIGWILPTLFLIACVVATFIGIGILRKNEHATKAELDSIKKVNAEIELQIQKKDSSIAGLKSIVEAQDLVIESRELEVRQSKARENKIRKEYESIKRLHFTSDKQRDSILTILYPTGHNF